MDIEYGKCEVCGKEAPLTRTYYHYNGLKCDCHSPEHFDLVRHCVNCTPKQRRTTRVELTVEQACHIGELLTAEREGCEYFGEDIDGGGLWKCTHCDAEQIIDGGTPFTNGMGYCAGCGRPIRTIRYNKWYYNSEEDYGEREVIETIAEAALAGKE